MDEDLYRVELTASFLKRLNATLALLTEADAAFAFYDMLAELRATVFPNLVRFPRIGWRYFREISVKASYPFVGTPASEQTYG